MLKTILKVSLIALSLVFVSALVIHVAPAQAQGRECFKKVREAKTGKNPFTGQVQDYIDIDVDFDKECAVIRDNRENINDYDAGAAIYCDANGVSIYDLDISGKGTFAFRANWNEVNSVPNPPEVNTLIDEGNGFALYRLTTGEMQVNGSDNSYPPMPYVFIWNGCTQAEASK